MATSCTITENVASPLEIVCREIEGLRFMSHDYDILDLVFSDKDHTLGWRICIVDAAKMSTTCVNFIPTCPTDQGNTRHVAPDEYLLWSIERVTRYVPQYLEAYLQANPEEIMNSAIAQLLRTTIRYWQEINLDAETVKLKCDTTQRAMIIRVRSDIDVVTALREARRKLEEAIVALGLTPCAD